MNSLIIISRDESLLRTRAYLLSHIADVVPADPVEASKLLAVQRFDLVLLCQTLGPEETAKMVSLAHGLSPGARFLRFAMLPDHAHRYGEDLVISPADPMALIARVKALLAVRAH